MIKPCPCGHPGCKSYIPERIRCACNSLGKEEALLIDAAPDLLQTLENIANAKRVSFKDAGEFWTWAQKLARSAVTQAKGEPNATSL